MKYWFQDLHNNRTQGRPSPLHKIAEYDGHSESWVVESVQTDQLH